MSPRLVLALALQFAAATAHAQAPGEWTPPPGPAEGPPAPAAAPVFPQKWSIAAGFGNVRYVDAMSAGEAAFDIGHLALRYRAGRHLELEASGAGGRELLEDGSEGQLAMGSFTFAARYRFNPEQHWNGWLLGGLGVTTIAPHDASDQVLESAQRGHAVLGLGLEHRWTQFAIQGELRGYAVGPSQAETDAEQLYGQMATTDISGAQVSLGAAYYF